MTQFDFDTTTYLRRIGLASAPSADEHGLRTLHHAQFSSIPFENFNIQLGRPVRLDPPSLVEKLVRQKRGGYCFELNGLLLLAMRALGFEARPLLARVHMAGEPGGHTHQLNYTEIVGQGWIVDAGFGAGGLRAPMKLVEGDVAQTPEGATRTWSYGLRREKPWGWVMRTLEGETWKDSYSFDLTWVIDADLAVGNHYTSTSPETHFTTTRVASAPRPDGRVSLRDFELTTLAGTKKTIEPIAPGAAYLDLLAKVFGITLDAQYEDLLALTPHNTPQS